MACAPIFDLIQRVGGMDDEEMLKVFNMGIGMIVIVAESDLTEILERLEKLGEKAYHLGTIEKRENDQPTVSFIS